MNMRAEENCNYLFKFLIIGDKQVGKSCLLSQYIGGKFKEDYEETIGVEFESKIIEVNDDIRIQIQSWETVIAFDYIRLVRR